MHYYKVSENGEFQCLLLKETHGAGICTFLNKFSGSTIRYRMSQVHKTIMSAADEYLSSLELQVLNEKQNYFSTKIRLELLKKELYDFKKGISNLENKNKKMDKKILTSHVLITATVLGFCLITTKALCDRTASSGKTYR